MRDLVDDDRLPDAGRGIGVELQEPPPSAVVANKIESTDQWNPGLLPRKELGREPWKPPLFHESAILHNDRACSVERSGKCARQPLDLPVLVGIENHRVQ